MPSKGDFTLGVVGYMDERGGECYGRVLLPYVTGVC